MTEVRQRRSASSQKQQQRKKQQQQNNNVESVNDGEMEDEREPFLMSGDSTDGIHEMQQPPVLQKNLASLTQDSSTDPLDGSTIIPLVQRSIFLRLDVWPFVVLYAMAVILDRLAPSNISTTSSTSQHEAATVQLVLVLKRITFPVLLFAHVFLALLQQWRVSVKCFVGYQQVSGLTRGDKNESKQPVWTHCLVTAQRTVSDGHPPFSAICPVITQSSSSSHGRTILVVSFQDTVFRAVFPSNKCTNNGSDSLEDDPDMNQIWQIPGAAVAATTAAGDKQILSNENHSLFHRLRYPDSLSFAFYKSWRGHDLQSARQAHQVYGSNQTELQLPPFSELLSEQLVAPFFLFQIFCVALWSLDEYWYYALFTLFALLMFESTVAYNRLKSLERLRGTLRHPYPVLVYRHQSWIRIMSNELVPGDMVSLLSSFGAGHFQFQKQQQPQQANLHVPADVLLLRGSGVLDESLLTGESVPQLKDAIDLNLKEDGGKQQRCLDWQENKQQILFGGTILVSHDGGAKPNENDATTTTLDQLNIPKPPNNGITCFVLRTGFETAQGSLIRTMAHSSKQAADGIHTRDTFIFVVILLCCAIVSAMTVLLDGWKDETRNRFRLILHVIIIITSVVPPELPMELSLAVTNSVADLMKRCRVFCTEPFRIPWAGKVDLCCFDKTGTLTSDKMQLSGVVVNGKDFVSSIADLDWSVLRVMVGCQSLAVRHSGGNNQRMQLEVVGDPLEQAVLKDTGYQFVRSDILIATGQASTRSPQSPKAVTILHRFAFTSRLKRMTVLTTEDSDPSVIWALSKGAPETMRGFFKEESVPSDYDDVSERHMRLGQRVLAIGYRCIGANVSILELKEKGRDAIERDLVFAGFLVLECPLKPDSQSVIAELKRSGHDVVMITGDAVLTAVEVARQVGIIESRAEEATLQTYELTEREQHPSGAGDGNNFLSKFVFHPLDPCQRSRHPSLMPLTDLEDLKRLSTRSEISFCVSGTTLTRLARAAVLFHESKMTNGHDLSSINEKNFLLHPAAQNILKDLVPLISVFARHAPRQKEAVIAAFNLAGRHTLMCGDGTNDVGALKRAHVGISIISAPEVEEKQREATLEIARVKAEEKRERKAQKKKNLHQQLKKSSSRTRNASLAESLRKLREAQEDLDHVELGDASIASPFTSRAVSIVCCKDVLQQGRCTLVTMLQIYKILGINCLVNALVLSKLFLHGVKQGDRQMTFLGICVASLFLFVTQAKPLPILSPIRPPSSVLCMQAILSITAQFAIHFAAIMLATEVSLAFVDPFDPSMIPDGSFNPNILNTSTFLLTMLATINTFAVNYRGRPFMESLSDNKLMLRSLQVMYVALFVCALQLFPPLNDLLQLAPFPDENPEHHGDDNWISSNSNLEVVVAVVRAVKFPFFIAALMVIDTGCSVFVECSIVRIFEGRQ